MHSHNRHYSVDTGLACEHTSFEKVLMILIADHLSPNLMEQLSFVKTILSSAQNRRAVILSEAKNPREFEPSGSNSRETVRGVDPELVEGLRVA
jgi:hypothetical protein